MPVFAPENFRPGIGSDRAVLDQFMTDRFREMLPQLYRLHLGRTATVGS